jgi:hypothetical protein
LLRVILVLGKITDGNHHAHPSHNSYGYTHDRANASTGRMRRALVVPHYVAEQQPWVREFVRGKPVPRHRLSGNQVVSAKSISTRAQSVRRDFLHVIPPGD